MGLCLRRLRLQYPLQGWQGSSGISGSFQAESVATFDWNRWQVSTGISGNLRAEYAGVLVVYSLSRLARNTTETLELGERLAKAGADLVSLSEKIDTTSAAGKMVFRMLAVLAEFERDQISERTRVAMQHMRCEGKRVGFFFNDTAPTE